MMKQHNAFNHGMRIGEIKMKIICINIENIHFESREIEVFYSSSPIEEQTGIVEVTYNIETSIGKIKNKIQMFDVDYEKLNLQQLKDYILRELGVTKESEQTIKDAPTVTLHEELAKRAGVKETNLHPYAETIIAGERVLGPARILINKD